MFDVVGIGECCVDLIGVVHTMPRENSKKDITSFHQSVGGSVINSLLTLSNLKLNTSFIGSIGRDDYGVFVKSILAKNKINVYNLREDFDKTPFHFVILSRKNQSRTIFKKKGSEIVDRKLTEYDKFTIRNTKFLLIDRHMGDSGLEAAHYAKKFGTRIVFDPSDKYNGFVDKMLSIADVFIAPLGFTGNALFRGSPEEAIMRIWRKNRKTVVLTMGPDGCLATKGKSILRVPRYNRFRTIDTNGAGDVFHGAFVYGMHKGWTLEATCKFANKIAALKCSIFGNDLRKLNLTHYAK